MVGPVSRKKEIVCVRRRRVMREFTSTWIVTIYTSKINSITTTVIKGSKEETLETLAAVLWLATQRPMCLPNIK